ncbi:GtrA family protein [Paenibacillus sp. 481]|uniref:GtrA family protein n=1 Tax=Paenibacillus sp. 481 TaxID=2835869 RepID=UPI001E5911C1|nr:GtrA family protein [Paenibacillus sp. 481]
MKFLSKEFLKFVVVGIVNTASTYLIYLLLLSVLSYTLSYTVSYVCGIFISYVLNTYYVFKEKLNYKKMIQYPLVYVVQYVLNAIMLYLLIDYLGLEKEYAPLIVIILSIPITFILSRLIIKKND